MELTKEQTLQIIARHEKRVSLKRRFKIKTKYRSECPICGNNIYVGWMQTKADMVICCSCKEAGRDMTPKAKLHHMKRIKEKQLAEIEKYASWLVL